MGGEKKPVAVTDHLFKFCLFVPVYFVLSVYISVDFITAS